MPWVVQHPLRYIGGKPRGEGKNLGECATLAQVLVAEQHQSPVMPLTGEWAPGAKVRGCALIPGTVIAVFDHGVYSGKSGKAHTALYVRQSIEGIEVVHQHKRCLKIKGTLIRFGGGRLREFSTPPGFNVDVSNSTVPSVHYSDQRVYNHKSGVNLANKSGIVTLEDDADNYYVVERKRKVNPEDFAVHLSAPIARNL